MPLLGKKVFHLAKPLVTIDPEGSVYYVKHTGECFQTKDEYSKRISLYNEKVWTCQCTGHINLTHEEAWKSEQDARQLLKKTYPEYLEKPVLEIVHHSILPLDMLIDKSYVKINSMFFPGDHVQFKVKNGGRVIKGRVVNIDNGKEEETRMSPCSDKENSDSTDCNHNETTPRKYPPKLLPYKYNIRLLEEDKIISAVPAEDLVRYDRPPNKDMLRLFIRAHSLRQGTSTTSPWIVDAKLVRKYSLPSKMAGASNGNLVTKCDLSTLTMTNGEDKKRRNSAEDVNVLRRKKLKLELMPINNQHGYSKMAKSVSNLSVLKEAEVKNGNGNEGEVSTTVDNKPRLLVVDMTPPVAKVSSKLSNSTVTLSSSPSSSSRSSPELDHSYSTPKKKNSSTNNNPKMPLVTSKKTVKKTSTNQTTQVVKLGQSKTTTGKTAMTKKNSTSTNLDKASEKSTKLEQSPEVKIIKSAKGNPVKNFLKSTASKRVNGDKLKSTSPKKRKMKQVTLFDLSAIKKSSPRVVLDKNEVNSSMISKKNSEKNSPKKSPTKMSNKSPAKNPSTTNKTTDKKPGASSATSKDKAKRPIKKLTPAQISMLVQRISALLSSQQKTRNFAPLLDQLIASLTTHEIECLPDLVKERLDRRIKFKEWKIKCAGLTKEERIKLLKEERPFKRIQTIPQPVVEVTVLKPLPQPHLVATPDGVPNELFGDVVMVVEFINCYCGLLMPNESYPVQTDLLLKAVGSGNEGFGYLSRILLILLQTLLQDRLAEDYKELGVRLSDLPINIHTTSELVRLCLRKHDENLDHEKYDESDEYEDVHENVLSLLETGELYQLIPEEKLRILVGLCHRILNSYSVQEYMEQKQKNSLSLWKELNEQKRLIASKMSEWKDVKVEAKVVDTTNPESKLGDGEENKDNKDGEEKSEESNKDEANSNRPGLRTQKSREIAALEKKKADEKKLLQIEKSTTLARKELTEKKYQAAHIAATVALRQTPLGYDRNHARYWLFSHGTSGIFLEKGWVTEHIDYDVKSRDEIKPTTRNDDSEYDSEDEPLANLKKKSEYSEDSVPVSGQNLWFNYDNMTEVEELMSCLNPNGAREGKLLAKLKKKQQDIGKSFTLRESQVVLKPSDGDRELIDAFKKELTETEVRVRKGLLGGVPNLSQWESKLEAATGLHELIPCLLETQANVLPRFLRGIMKMEEMIDFLKPPSNDVGKVQRWIDAVENCPTMSRLHVLLGVLDACILWEKSSENAKCKICRRKDEDLVLILCDNCNLAFHLFCLRPALTRVPDGEWICPACQPTSTRQSERAGKLQSRQNDEETQTAETTKTNDSSNERRLRSGTRTNLRSRPEKTPQWKDESTSSSEAENEEMSDNSESGSESDSKAEECCMCGGDEDVVKCSKCNLGYHTFCHFPAMHNKPRGKWICNPCHSGKKPKSIQKARKKWQKWKHVPADEATTSVTRRMSARNQNNGDGDDGDSVQQITTRLRQKINDSTTENSDGPKISTRQARALRRALERDD